MHPSVQLTDPNFQTQHSGKCDLHLTLATDVLSYAVVDKGQDQLRILFSTETESSTADALQEAIPSELALGYHFRKVKISFLTPQFTFIPVELFEKDQLNDYARFFEFGQGDELFINYIHAAKCVAVFALPGDLATSLKQQFHQPQFYHTSAALIEGGFKLSGQQEGPSVLLNFAKDSFEVVYIADGKLIFYNSFPGRNADEFNYFLLHLMDSLTIKPEQTDWIVAGKQQNEWLERLQKYTSTIREADKQAIVNVSETFEPVAAADYFSLVALALCE